MALLNPPVCDFNQAAVDFDLPGVDGQRWNLAKCRGKNGLLIMFICNHCPYVQAVLDKIARDADELQTYGVATAAICANDAVGYPEDSFANMRKLAAQVPFNFPYLHDESQAVAKKYGAICTPDFFGYNADLQLQYRGRLDASAAKSDPDSPRDLFQAMRQVATTGEGPAEQTASIGCSIKWKK